MTEINGELLEKIMGGGLSASNPVAKMTRDQAEAIAATLGDGRDMGSWKTMSGAEFMKWWEDTHREMLDNR